jgi:hypothetical protein
MNTYNPSTWEAETSLGYIVRPYLKGKKKRKEKERISQTK